MQLERQNHTKSIQNPTEVRSVGAQVIPKCLPWLIFGIIGSSAAHSFTYFYHIICHCQSTSSEFLPTGSNELTASLFTAISAHKPRGFTQYVIFDKNTLNETELDDGALTLSFLSLFVHNFKLFWKWRIIYNKRKIPIKGEKWKFTFCSLLNCCSHIWGQC